MRISELLILPLFNCKADEQPNKLVFGRSRCPGGKRSLLHTFEHKKETTIQIQDSRPSMKPKEEQAFSQEECFVSSFCQKISTLRSEDISTEELLKATDIVLSW